MKKLICALMPFLVLMEAASASVVTYDFTATVNSMFEHNGVTGEDVTVSNSTMSGVLISNGNTIHGQFSFDTSTPLSPYYQPSQPANGSNLMYEGTGTFNRSTLTFDQSGYTFSSNPDSWLALIQVENLPTGQGTDFFSMSTVSTHSATDLELMNLNLFDRSGQAFSSGAIPLSLPLSAFGYAGIDYGWLRKSDGSQVHADATITSLTVGILCPVPEPQAVTMMAAGLFLLLGTMAKRRPRPLLPSEDESI